MPVLVRDLDLSVANLCTRYTGNFIVSDDFSSAFGCSVSPLYDRRNNVEMIVLPAPLSSGATVTFRVASATWGFGGRNQPFAVFVHNGY